MQYNFIRKQERLVEIMSANFVWEKKRGWLCILYMVLVDALFCMHIIIWICLSIKEGLLNN